MSDRVSLSLAIRGWRELSLDDLQPAFVCDGIPQEIRVQRLLVRGSTMALSAAFEPSGVWLHQEWTALGAGLLLTGQLCLPPDRGAVCLDRVELLSASCARFGEGSRFFEQDPYLAHVRALGQGEGPHRSLTCWAAHSPARRRSWVLGFLTGERWAGEVVLEGGHQPRWKAGFDGGGLRVEPGQELALEDALLLAGSDPWRLLETYGDSVAARHWVEPLPASPVTWCSWYPFRLTLSAERVLDIARLAARRLRPYGLCVLQLDLGWQQDHLPCAVAANQRFPGGLEALVASLTSLGLELGVWVAPYTISEFHPLYRDHPDWLLKDRAGMPVPYGTWHWPPRGRVFALDLTHPAALAWLEEQMRSLAERGVSYLKADFIGCIHHHQYRGRHDDQVVAGVGLEAARRGLDAVRRALTGALLLNCGGPELPGTGAWPLLYSTADSGDPGFPGWGHLRRNYGSNLAGHLFKQGRWGIIQPSCLCVGHPATLEEARLRATATFLSGGQVDIGDDLAALPEDRWHVLLSSLPPQGRPARPVDYFDPIARITSSYDTSTGQRRDLDVPVLADSSSRLWHLPVDGGWDQWDLVGLFEYETPCTEKGEPLLLRFVLPLERLGPDADQTYWVCEFWSGAFLGTLRPEEQAPAAYLHPGDVAGLLSRPHPGVLEAAFFGPAVKLFALRRARPHPWVVGSSFHQSGGLELEGVAWDPVAHTLSGRLCRPGPETGLLFVCDAPLRSPDVLPRASCDGAAVAVHRGGGGAVIVPLQASRSGHTWQLTWD